MKSAESAHPIATMTSTLNVPCTVLQNDPLVYMAIIPGNWLLKHTTPVWRIKDPLKGFQRAVSERRARAIAVAVLNQQRTFPNAIVLATNVPTYPVAANALSLPPNARFLVVDGQHRLYAQQFSPLYEAKYACIIHMGLSLVQMAKLFLEINDTQKRVPSSLRWDLVRLVRPEEDPFAVVASDMIFEMVNDRNNPLYQRVDLTGEQPEITLKQGSLAPELRLILSNKLSPLRDLEFDDKCDVVTRYISAIRDLDPDGWKLAQTPFYKARVFRVLIRLLPEVIHKLRKSATAISASEYSRILRRIDPVTLSDERIRAAQGTAGMKAIYTIIRRQMFRE